MQAANHEGLDVWRTLIRRLTAKALPQPLGDDERRERAIGAVDVAPSVRGGQDAAAGHHSRGVRRRHLLPELDLLRGEIETVDLARPAPSSRQVDGPAVPAPPAHVQVDVSPSDLTRGTTGERNEDDGVGPGLHGHVAAVRRDRPRLRDTDVVSFVASTRPRRPRILRVLRRVF